MNATLGVFSAYTSDTSDLIRSPDFKQHLVSFYRINFQITSSYALLLVEDVATVRHFFLIYIVVCYNNISVFIFGLKRIVLPFLDHFMTCLCQLLFPESGVVTVLSQHVGELMLQLVKPGLPNL